ncbi:MAG: glycosyltransferase [Myxococcales bacterium]|nr:glycosyltransferase [Myxococcales bacterium]
MHLALVQRLARASRFLGSHAGTRASRAACTSSGTCPRRSCRPCSGVATCLCHPSFEEGAGNPPCEALGSGPPVVTSNVSSMPEVSGDAALLVDPHDVDEIAVALQRIAGDPTWRRAPRENLVRARIYRWRHTAEDTLAVYREIAAETGRS